MAGSLLDEFQAIVDSLNEAGIDYAVAGALELAGRLQDLADIARLQGDTDES